MPMNTPLQNDLANMESLLDAVKHQGLDFLGQLSNRGTSTNAVVQAVEALNETGLGGLEALSQFNQKLEKLIVASAGPRYWGFVTGGATAAAIMGDRVSSFFFPKPPTTKKNL